MKEKFPIIRAGHVFNKYSGTYRNMINLHYQSIEIDYPCRLDAMAINPAAVVYNENMVFTPGEVVVSISRFIKVKIKMISETGGVLKIGKATKRKVLVKHSYLLMCDALGIAPSLEIDVDSNMVPKHCGFGSSSSTIAAVAASINEMYGCPIANEDLIKYLASNHGEEISDEDENNLKVVQCIGGGATNGLVEEGIIIIAGKATTIAKTKYNGKVLVALPRDFVTKDAKVLMELEEKNLWKFKKTGDLYAPKIAYDLLHKALPELKQGKIKSLADIVFDYRFNMGSNENCSFVYDGLVKLGNNLRCLYEENNCDFLSLSSVGPAFFAIVSNDRQEKICRKKMQELNLKIIETEIFNSTYKIVASKGFKCYWQKKEVATAFTLRKPSKYITDEIDNIDIYNKNCIDIGCGGGRYTEYLKSKGANVLSIDKYEEMIGDVNNRKINFIKGSMDKIPVKDKSYDLALSIGVVHNAVSLKEYENSLKEMYRVLNDNKIAILSVFTEDLITDDLIKYDDNLYFIKNRPPMVLLKKEQIIKMLENIGFEIEKVLDEHLTDVGGGKRNVYSLLLKKKKL